MKIIFSRKGFDSSAGGCASPIFPDGTLWSIPIPDKHNKKRYKDLEFSYKSESIVKILNELSNQRLVTAGKVADCDYTSDTANCHHDPQLMDGNNFQGIVFRTGR